MRPMEAVPQSGAPEVTVAAAVQRSGADHERGLAGRLREPAAGLQQPVPSG